jgi:epoxyqueuosine reductase
MSIEEKIKKLAVQTGFELCGITTAEPFYDLEPILKQRIKDGTHSEFEELNLAKRLDPRLSAPEANSIIALAKAYYKPNLCKPEGQGWIACCAKGRDYHLNFREGMEELSSLLKNELGLTPLESMVDTGPLVDRAVAARAGIGWYGKNCSILAPSLGSWLVLGQILLKEKLKADAPLNDMCASCDKCLKACPTKALMGPYQLNATMCLSALTQTKSIIPKKYRSLLGTRIYGCDTCQEVCPYNKISTESLRPEENETIDLLALLGMSNKDFREKYGSKAFAWRGKNILQRNAIIALGNLKNHSATEDLVRILNGPNTMLRGYSAWALGRLKSQKAVEALRKALEQEEDSWVREEIRDALQN